MRGLSASLLLFCMALPFGSNAMERTEADSMIARAQRAYSAGDQDQALSLYDSVNTRFTSAGLLYDIGNCHFKRNDIPHAILYYERALLLEPGAEDIRSNLDLARQQTLDRVNELPGFQLGGDWERWRGGRDVDQWARRSLWAWAIAMLLLGLSMPTAGLFLKRFLQVLAGIAAVGAVSAVLLASARTREVRHPDGAIVMAPRIDVTSEPRDGSTALFLLHAGTKVTVRKEEAGWAEVALANGNVGWMPMRAIERI
ncbi:MAG: tetratricopeptide repeat protein [Flavobacteriales bacterium]|nr:tetratricopeptide repeat protein [Flavobacteriales bacterium]